MGLYCFGIDVGGTTVKCGLFKTDGDTCGEMGNSYKNRK